MFLVTCAESVPAVFRVALLSSLPEHELAFSGDPVAAGGAAIYGSVFPKRGVRAAQKSLNKASYPTPTSLQFDSMIFHGADRLRRSAEWH
jgi:hypothetical protein